MKKQIFSFIQKNILIITLLATVIMITVPLANVSAKVTNYNAHHRTVISNLNSLSGHMKIGRQSLPKNWKQILHLNKLTFKKHNIKTTK